MKTNYVIFHHDDMDGYCSANIIANYIYKKDENASIEAIEYNYKNTYPSLEQITTKDDIKEIFIVDISVKNENVGSIEDLYENCEKLIIIDHHITSIKTFKDNIFLSNETAVEDGIGVYINTSYCATVLCWCYANMTSLMELERGTFDFVFPDIDKIPNIPDFIKYVDSWDTWKFSVEKTREFKLGLELFKNSWNPILRSNIIKSLIDAKPQTLESSIFINDIITKGELINNFSNRMNKRILSNAHIGRFLNYKALIVNTCVYDGFLFKEYDISSIDIFVAYYEYYDENEDKKYTYSLYGNSTKVDCAAIAENFGGGGHRGAAGFRTTMSIDEINGEKESSFLKKVVNFFRRITKSKKRNMEE